MRQHRLSAVSIAAAAVALAGTISQAAPAQRASHTKSGALSCDISAGLGLIVGSQKQISCLFIPAAPGPQEAYVGTINKFGPDPSATNDGQMVWEVYAPGSRQFGALVGDYAGGSAKATGGNGASAKTLFGGSDRTVTLQPIAIDSQVGLNVAAGVTELVLRPAR